MAILNAKTKVLIIGTGLSGVALAQIFRKANVEFEIFERDNGTRHQGWTIALDKFVNLQYAEKVIH
jgi:cation diffusion facilitator CzcD-associated flavoprotein CzcO